MRDSAEGPNPASVSPFCFLLRDGNSPKIRLTLLHGSPVIVQKCTGQKSFRAKVWRVQRPLRPFFAVPGEDGKRGFRAKVFENACGAGVLTKKNYTATLTHIVSKLPCSYGGAEGSRTPVRRPEDQSISERSLRFDIPSAGLPQTGFRFQ